MTFRKNDNDNLGLSCALSADQPDSSFNDENTVERQDRLEKLRDQIRAGTYRPSIGEIAINLVKGSMNSDSFR